MNTFINHIKELKNYLILWISQSLSSLGSRMTSYALLLWVYQQGNSTMSVAILALCTYLPSISLSFLAGTFVDRHNKKKIILICDCIAAMGTISVFTLMSLGMLKLMHIYIINFLISVMDAFQSPADAVIVSKIVPEKYYMKTSGLNSISISVVTILTPALATALITFTGINVIFIIDIATFAFAFLSLMLFIRLPEALEEAKDKKEHNSYLHDCKEGYLFIIKHKAILQLILFFTIINLLAYIGGAGLSTTITAMVLSRIPDGRAILGAVSAAIGLGTLIGGIIVTVMKPPKSRVAAIFICCGISFLICDISLGVSHNPMVWIIANFIGNIPMAHISANQSVIMRTKVPIELQGRVFSARDTLQYSTIPLGYLLGGVLADYVFEPLMKGDSFVKHFLAVLVGEGKGSGIAVIFILTGTLGTIISFCGYFNKKMRILDERST